MDEEEVKRLQACHWVLLVLPPGLDGSVSDGLQSSFCDSVKVMRHDPAPPPHGLLQSHAPAPLRLLGLITGGGVNGLRSPGAVVQRKVPPSRGNEVCRQWALAGPTGGGRPSGPAALPSRAVCAPAFRSSISP